MLLLLQLLSLLGVVSTATIPFDFAGRGTVAAVHDLVVRAVSPAAAAAFDLHINRDLCYDAAKKASLPTRSGLCYRLSALAGGRVRIEGSSGVELARGVGTYLRQHHNVSFSWARTGGFQTHLATPPSEWPTVPETLHMRRSNISYYQNVVASSYTHAFWTFTDWEHMLDWMALSGINVASQSHQKRRRNMVLRCVSQHRQGGGTRLESSIKTE